MLRLYQGITMLLSADHDRCTSFLDAVFIVVMITCLLYMVLEIQKSDWCKAYRHITIQSIYKQQKDLHEPLPIITLNYLMFSEAKCLTVLFHDDCNNLPHIYPVSVSGVPFINLFQGPELYVKSTNCSDPSM